MNKKTSTLISLLALIAGMSMLTYASADLYRLFCQVTGYGGTTKTAKFVNPTGKKYDREFIVDFNADISEDLDWKFFPLQRKIKIHPGEDKLIFYQAVNNSDKPITGIATYNVTPFVVGEYFNKIQCFCFEEQKIMPKESVVFPVSFFIDPEILQNKSLRNLRNITLSYSFYPSQKSSSTTSGE